MIFVFQSFLKIIFQINSGKWIVSRPQHYSKNLPLVNKANNTNEEVNQPPQTNSPPPPLPSQPQQSLNGTHLSATTTATEDPLILNRTSIDEEETVKGTSHELTIIGG